MTDAEDLDSRLLRCVECGEFYPARTTDDGDLVPEGATAGGRCSLCGGDEFEQVILDPDPDSDRD